MDNRGGYYSERADILSVSRALMDHISAMARPSVLSGVVMKTLIKRIVKWLRGRQALRAGGPEDELELART